MDADTCDHEEADVEYDEAVDYYSPNNYSTRERRTLVYRRVCPTCGPITDWREERSA